MKKFLPLLLAIGAVLPLNAEIMPPGEKISLDVPGWAPMFPFAIPKESNGIPTITDVRAWGNSPTEAGADGFIRVEGGHFVNDRGRVRFVGTNMTGPANMPATPEDADFLARSMARFGINLVRLHFLDTTWGILQENPKTLTLIDPDKRDKLDRMIYAFKKQGIYVNINLHVGRKLDDRDGFPNAKERPKYDKGVDNFDPRMIAFLKQYTKDLLTHVNPYTKLPYTDDPCVACIEINNENCVTSSWRWGNLDTLPEPYRTTLQNLWNDWLAKKYSSTKELRRAWGCNVYPLSGNLLPADAFEKKSRAWMLVHPSQNGIATSEFTSESTWLLNITKKGDVSWAPQFHCAPFRVEKGVPYALTIRYRGKTNQLIHLGVTKNHPDWGSLGGSTPLEATEEWQETSLEFVATQTDDNARVQFWNFQDGDRLEIGGMTLVSGGRLGLADDETLEARTIPVPTCAVASRTQTEGMFHDFSDFLITLENEYWQTMYHYVKDELKAKAPIAGTQLQYGSWHAQARLDYCDIHAYWNHPRWTDKPWANDNWYVTNTSMLNTVGKDTESGIRLPALRVFGKPYTISEYNNPFPNMYQSEGLPTLFAMGAFQDWSAIYQYTWLHTNAYDPQNVTGYFDLAGNTIQLAHLPACWAMFVRGDVKQGTQYRFAPELSEAKERALFRNSRTGYHRQLGDLVNYAMAFAVRTGLVLPETVKPEENPGKTVTGWQDLAEKFGSPEKKWIRNETDQFYMNFERDGKAYFTVQSPQTKLFTGFVDGRTFEIGNLTLKPGKTRLDFLTLSLTQAYRGHLLLTATGMMANTGQQLEDCGNHRLTHRMHLGEAPVLLEGIPAELVLKTSAKSVKCYALDPTGKRKMDVPVTLENGTAKWNIDPKYQTIWYELEIH
ncbi:MAG: cellulase family glycosylhydrolase [Planctomycetia bacterium]|nr:cellulase family glycosylhydrolase [Planctomycetia bacterium]